LPSPTAVVGSLKSKVTPAGSTQAAEGMDNAGVDIVRAQY
jgi:hypothetical protein